jgi:hypothetical protein
MQHVNHAPHGGTIGENGLLYRGGEFVPFYKPRPLMPQVDDKAYPAMRLWLTDNAIPFFTETVDAWKLSPRQRIDAVKASRIPDSVLAIPLLVSREGFILDGNHRWLAHVMQGKACQVIRIGLTFDDAIAALFRFLSETPNATLERELSRA